MADLTVLILGGTAEARILAERLAGRPGFRATVSLAGRTRSPATPPCALRVGGFGGADGLAAWLAAHAIDALVDATHPFARTISANARAAAEVAGVPLIVIARPAWQPVAGDRWTRVPDMAAAARAIGEAPRRVLLAIGRQEVAAFREAPQHRYLVRSVEPPDPAALPPEAETLLVRGPFPEAEEHALLAARDIEVVVAKNSGGEATYGKISAARALGLPVVMVDRPPTEGMTPEEALAHLAALAAARGV